MIKRMILNLNPAQSERFGRLLIVASGGLNAMFSVVLLMFAARTIPLEDIGILTIALAIAKLLLNIGKYGMRNYQVTETQDIAFSQWLCSRVITVGCMLLCAAAYIVWQMVVHAYSPYKSAIIFLVCLIYAGECLEDIYTGYYQKMGRLDVSSMIQIIRYLVLYVVYFLGLYITRSLLFSSIAALLTSLLAVWLCAVRPLQYFRIRVSRPRKEIILKILTECFPLFLMSFVLIYMSNAPKYEIDTLYDAHVQAHFGFVSMPIFSIGLLSGFIYQPQLVNLSRCWKERQIMSFRRIVRRQLLYIGLISIAALVTGWFAGIPVLSLLYHTRELDAYKTIFMVLLLGGSGTAVINFLTSVLVIFRSQKAILYSHLAASLLIFLTIKPAIRFAGILGAVWNTAALTWLLAIALIVVYIYTIQHQTDA